jgi:hypothetical protein
MNSLWSTIQMRAQVSSSPRRACCENDVIFRKGHSVLPQSKGLFRRRLLCVIPAAFREHTYPSLSKAQIFQFKVPSNNDMCCHIQFQAFKRTSRATCCDKRALRWHQWGRELLRHVPQSLLLPLLYRSILSGKKPPHM